MPSKEIKELRQSGRLEDALTMAKAELQADPNNIWPKRNISWVYYEYLKLNASADQFNDFIVWLTEIKNLTLPAEEKMLFDNVGWQIGKIVFSLSKPEQVEAQKSIAIFEHIQSFHFTKPSEGYSFLFKAFHKALKETDKYLVFADWWDFKNFRSEDFQKEKLPNGKEVMSIAEQGYIAYSKHLLPKQTPFGEEIFNKDKAEAFLPVLSGIAENYPNMQYPAYFTAKLLLALGDKENMLGSLLPFARKKRNDFWVWQILAEAFSSDQEKVFACYCKALSCKSPKEMLVSLRQKVAATMISKKMYNEAKTEIEILIQARTMHEFKIPNEVINWQSLDWYKSATTFKSNVEFYKGYTNIAESLLFSDTPEEYVIVEFVNTDKKMLNFIASETKFGFFKYDRFLKDVKVGDILKVRFQGGSNESIYQVYTAIKEDNELFGRQFIKEIEGTVKVPTGKPFGFLDDAFIHPSAVSKMKLTDGMHFKGRAIKSYNQDKKKWGWKLI